jgi:hypothetical protein
MQNKNGSCNGNAATSSIGDADNRWVVVHRSLFPIQTRKGEKERERKRRGIIACALY